MGKQSDFKIIPYRNRTGSLGDIGGSAGTNDRYWAKLYVENIYVSSGDIYVDGVSLGTHQDDATIHFTEASIDHTAITNIGTNTHADIDTYIAGAGGGILVPGNNTEVLYNDSAALGADAGLTYNKTANQLYVGGALVGSLYGAIYGRHATINLCRIDADTTVGAGRRVGFQFLSDSGLANSQQWQISHGFTDSAKALEFYDVTNGVIGLSIASDPIVTAITTTSFEVNGKIEIGGTQGGYLVLGFVGPQGDKGGKIELNAGTIYNDWTVEVRANNFLATVNSVNAVEFQLFNDGAGTASYYCDGSVHALVDVRADTFFNHNGTVGVTNTATGFITDIDSSGGIITAITKVNAFAFPAVDGTVNQVMQTDGAGNLSWVAQGATDWTQATGLDAGASLTTGTLNCLVGQRAGTSVTTGKYITAVGHEAGKNMTATAATPTELADYCTAVGYRALYTNVQGRSNTALGYKAGYTITNIPASTPAAKDANNSWGDYSTFVGTSAGENCYAGFCTFVGAFAGMNLKEGYDAVFIGLAAGMWMGYTTAATADGRIYNTFVGSNAGIFAESGVRNTYIGTSAGYGMFTGSANAPTTVLGTGSYNTYVGHIAGWYAKSGDYNTALGYRSLTGLNSSTGITGDYNIAIGVYAGDATIHTLTGATCIGYNSDASASYNLILGSAATVHSGNDQQVRIGMGINAATAKCHILQGSTTANIPVLWLQQSDDSEQFIDFRANNGASLTYPVSTYTTEGGTVRYVRCAINGADYWFRGCTAPTS